MKEGYVYRTLKNTPFEQKGGIKYLTKRLCPMNSQLSYWDRSLQGYYFCWVKSQSLIPSIE